MGCSCTSCYAAMRVAMLPSGPVMLPGVIPALVNLGALTPSEFAADLVESQEWTCFPGLEECHEYAESIVDQFFAALSDTAIDFQTDVWLLLVAANDPRSPAGRR